MPSLLQQLASLAVIFHLTMGCSLHHGVGIAGCERGDCSHRRQPGVGEKVSDCHDSGHRHQDLIPDCDLGFAVALDGAESPHERDHRCCQDDECHVIKLVTTPFLAFDFRIQYLGGAENDALVSQSSPIGIGRELDANCWRSRLPVRAHLWFGVLTI